MGGEGWDLALDEEGGIHDAADFAEGLAFDASLAFELFVVIVLVLEPCDGVWDGGGAAGEGAIGAEGWGLWGIGSAEGEGGLGTFGQSGGLAVISDDGWGDEDNEVTFVLSAGVVFEEVTDAGEVFSERDTGAVAAVHGFFESADGEGVATGDLEGGLVDAGGGDGVIVFASAGVDAGFADEA